MNLLGAVLVVLAFVALMRVTGLIASALEVVTRSREAARVMADQELNDDAKETAMKRIAKRLAVLVGLLVGSSALALLLPITAIWLLDKAGFLSLDNVLRILLRFDFLLLATLVGVAAYWAVARIRT